MTMSASAGSSDRRGRGGAVAKVTVGVDSFAARTLMSLRLCRTLDLDMQTSNGVGLIDVSNRPLKIEGVVMVKLTEGLGVSCRSVIVEAVVINPLECGCDILLGIDAQQQFGGRITYDVNSGTAQLVGAFLPSGSDDCTIVEDTDFTLVKMGGYWTVDLRFTTEPRQLQRVPRFYNKKFIDDDEVDQEIMDWLKDGVISEVKSLPSGDYGMVPVNVVHQEHKRASCRITFDCTELNKFVACTTTYDTNEVCLHEIRQWRVMAGNDQYKWYLVDLKKAYLSIRLGENIAKYFYFSYKGGLFNLKRLPFGLNVAGKVLFVLLRNITKNFHPETIRVYRDDFFVREDVVATLQEKMQENGFTCRCDLVDDINVLGLKLTTHQDETRWSRKIEVEKILEDAPMNTVRDLAGLAGRLAPAQYMVLNWLRPNVQLIRSLIGREAHLGWDSAPSMDLKSLCNDTLLLLKQKGDPTGGTWKVRQNGKVSLFVDASNDFVGSILLVDGQAVEDRCSSGEDHHINVRELSAVIYGLQMLLEWNVEKGNVTLFVDSRSVCAWVSALSRKEIVRVSGLYKALIETRLKIIRTMIEENGIGFEEIKLVTSKENLADVLTRVSRPKRVVAATPASAGNLRPVVALPRVFTLSKNAIEDGKSVEIVLTSLHEELLHGGAKTMMMTLNLYFPMFVEKYGAKAITIAIRSHLRACPICLLKNRSRNIKNVHGGLSYDPALKIGEMLQVDCVKMSSSSTYTGFITMIDVVSRYVEIEFLTGPPTAEAVLMALGAHFGRRGLPRIVRTDLGREFDNLRVNEYLEGLGVQVQHSPARYPQNMGVVERVHRSLLSLTRTPSKDSWHVRMLKAVFVYNNRPHGSLLYSTPMLVRSGEVAPPNVPERARVEPLQDVGVGTKAWLYTPATEKYEWPYVPVVVQKVIGDNVVEVRNVRTNRVSTIHLSHLVVPEGDEEEDEEEYEEAESDSLVWDLSHEVRNIDRELSEERSFHDAESNPSVYHDVEEGADAVLPELVPLAGSIPEQNTFTNTSGRSENDAVVTPRIVTRSGRSSRKPLRLIEQL